MKTNMRKALLSAALGCAMITPAFADGNDTRTGVFNVLFNDFIILEPNGTWPTAENPFRVFQNDIDRDQPSAPTNEETFKVTANRSWHVDISATLFVRDNSTPAPPGVGDNIDPFEIYQVKATQVPAFPDVNVLGGDWKFIAQAPGTRMVESPTGGFRKEFILQGRIFPKLSLNMSGMYSSTVSIIASLD